MSKIQMIVCGLIVVGLNSMAGLEVNGIKHNGVRINGIRLNGTKIIQKTLDSGLCEDGCRGLEQESGEPNPSPAPAPSNVVNASFEGYWDQEAEMGTMDFNRDGSVDKSDGDIFIQALSFVFAAIRPTTAKLKTPDGSVLFSAGPGEGGMFDPNTGDIISAY